MRKFRSLAAVAALVAFLGACGRIGVEETELTLVDHIEAGMIEQDVFVERTRGSGLVFRVGKEEARQFAGAPIYRTVRAVDPGPYSPAKNGPFPKGASLGISLGEWHAATGRLFYTCSSGDGRIESIFRGLVPNGTYSMWYFRIARSHVGCADCPFSMIALPVGRTDGTESKFVTDVRGRALFIAEFKPCLKPSDDELVSALAITYHSDGETHGPRLGARGHTSHVQLWSVLPAPGED
jgi:hypothetical protein